VSFPYLLIMKKKLLLITVLFSFFLVNSQSENNIKMVQSGSLYEVTIYYNNGEVMQHGFMTPENELHNLWKSYYDDGTIKCKAVYNKGEKVGIWHYYYRNEKAKRVTYEDNKVVKVELIDPEKE